MNPVSAPKGHNMPDNGAPEKGQVSEQIQDLMTDTPVRKGKSLGIERAALPYDERVLEIAAFPEPRRTQGIEFRFKAEGPGFGNFVQINRVVKPFCTESLCPDPGSRVIDGAGNTERL